MGGRGPLDLGLPADVAPGTGAVAGVEARRPPEVAEGGARALRRQRATAERRAKLRVVLTLGLWRR